MTTNIHLDSRAAPNTVVALTQPGGHPGIHVSFMRDTPAMFAQALARPFMAAEIPVGRPHRARSATRAVGDEVGVIVTFLVVSTLGGIAYDAERELIGRAVRVLRGILEEAPFRAEIRVRDRAAVTEYILPSGQDARRALDAYLADQEAGYFRGGRLQWSPERGWVAIETREPGSRSSDDWVAEQLRIGDEHHARIGWVLEMLREDEQPRLGD